MMIYPRPTNKELVDLEQSMSEEAMIEQLISQTGAAGRKGRVSVRSLYALAVGGEVPGSDDVDSVLALGPTFRAAYLRMLHSFALYYFPAVRAAGTEWAPHREVAGCKIDLDQDEGQLFVTVELPAGAERLPKALTVINKAGLSRRVELPEALRGVIYFPIVQDDELVMLLRDPDSEVYLA